MKYDSKNNQKVTQLDTNVSGKSQVLIAFLKASKSGVSHIKGKRLFQNTWTPTKKTPFYYP